MITKKEKEVLKEMQQEIINISKKIDILLGEDETRIEDVKVEDGLEKNVTKYLIKLGVPIRMKGFQYIRFGVMLMLKNEYKELSMLNDIYEQIAKEYSTKCSRVERGIRTAINHLYMYKGENLFLRDFFGNYPKLTNSGFLKLLAERIRMM